MDCNCCTCHSVFDGSHCSRSLTFKTFFFLIEILDFKSLWLLIKSSIPYWLFLPTLVGSFTLYSMARLSDISWGNRVSVSGSNFKNASQHEVAQSQQELSNNALGP